jgi:hypothetical protein
LLYNQCRLKKGKEGQGKPEKNTSRKSILPFHELTDHILSKTQKKGRKKLKLKSRKKKGLKIGREVKPRLRSRSFFSNLMIEQ